MRITSSSKSVGCVPIFPHLRVLGAQLDPSASIQPRMHADCTRTLGWNMCTSPTQRYVPRFCRRARHARRARRARRAASCEALLAPPARKSSGFGPSRPPCAGTSADGWLSRRVQLHLDVFDGARRLHPVRVASEKLLNRRPRPKRDFTSGRCFQVRAVATLP